MATCTRQRQCFRFRRFYFITIFILLLTGCKSTEVGIFYQPLNRDLSVSDQEWQRFSAQLPTENITRVITQWSRYGDEQFGGNTGWLAERFEVLLGNDLTLWFGLYSDPNYFKAIHSDINQQARYLDQYFLTMKQEYQNWKPWLNQHDKHIEGVYFPLELSDYDFSTKQQRSQVNRMLAQQLKFYQHPVMISLYMSGTITPGEMAEWTQQLSDIGLIVFVQDGAGTGSLEDETRLDYLNSLDCNIGRIEEIFKQNPDDTDFSASRLTKQEYQQVRSDTSCHLSSLFSLRYLPVLNNPLKLGD